MYFINSFRGYFVIHFNSVKKMQYKNLGTLFFDAGMIVMIKEVSLFKSKFRKFIQNIDL